MGRLAQMTASAALVLGLVVAGCGSSNSSSTSTSTPSTSASKTTSTQSTSTSTTKQQQSSGPGGEKLVSTTGEHVPINALKVTSPAFIEGGPIPVQYTCDGAGASPPLHWSGVPSGVKELIVLVSAFEEKAPGGGTLYAWAVAGLSPTLNGIQAGVLPSGAAVGRNSYGKTGYTLCPRKGSPPVHYAVVVYAMTSPVGAKPGFVADALAKTASKTAAFSGLTGFTYKRR